MACRPNGIDSAYRDVDPRSYWLRLLLFTAFICSGTVYFAWRTTVFNPEALSFSVAFYIAELIPFVSSCLLLYITLHRRDRQALPEPRRAAVDVFVATYNEDIDIVRRTIVAALRIRYPHETWLLDDGNRPAFAAMARELGCRYLARAENTHAKAGNLNNGLKYAAGEFIVVLDADHCAQPDFIDRVLGYFDDPRIAFVQTPQDYYNTDSFQHGRNKYAKLIWHEQSRFNYVEQPGRDFHNATLMCGCSSIVRRSALDEIGGFAVGTVTEDMHTAVRLMKRGWLPALHGAPLAFGIAPPDFQAFTRQRLRWAEGNLQVCRLERLPFAPNIGWRANLAYALLTFYYVDAWRKLFFYVAPMLSLALDVPPVYGRPLVFLAFMVPYALFAFLAFKEFSAGFGRAWRTEVDAMSRLSAGLAAIWGLFRRNIGFRVTPKVAVGKIPLLLLLPQFLILLLGLSVVCYAALVHTGYALGYWPHSGIPGGIAFVLGAVVLMHCAVAMQTIFMAYRSARPAPANYEHVVPLPIRIIWGNSVVTSFVRLISIESAVVAATDGLASHGGTVDVVLYLPTGACCTPARIEKMPDSGSLRLAFLWHCLSVRDQLDQALHAGRWHRIVSGRYEMSMTPFERLRLLRPPPQRKAEARPQWASILMRETLSPNDLRLGFVRGDLRGAGEVILFREVTGPIEVIAATSQSWIGRRFEIAGTADTPLLDEAALECQGGFRRSIRVIDLAQHISPGYRPEWIGSADLSQGEVYPASPLGIS